MCKLILLSNLPSRHHNSRMSHLSTTQLQGLSEMRRFSKELYPTVRDETFFESCGVADLIATCYGGRNRLVAMEYTRQSLVSRCVLLLSLSGRRLLQHRRQHQLQHRLQLGVLSFA
jgi:hypothetical protein